MKKINLKHKAMEENKMSVPIGIPISQINVGEHLYISIDDILLEQRNTKQGFEVWLYIRKTAFLRRLTSDLADLPIEKKGLGMTSGDFFIDFSDIRPIIALFTEDVIETNYYLSPVKVDYRYDDIDDFEENEIENTPSQKTDEDMFFNMDIIQKEINSMSIEDLHKMEASYKEYIDEIHGLINGVEKKFYIWLFDKLWIITENQRKVLEKKLTKPLEELNLDELDRKFLEATLREDYETCSKITSLKNTYYDRMQ